MCGILGAIGSDYSESDFSEALHLLDHRGPDNTAWVNHTFRGVNTWLGHTRLSIIDLSPEANQPFRSASGRNILIFNGEIYNYRELKEQLRRDHDVTFRTESDTELVAEAFEVWGTECVSYFNGMFAFSVYDLREGKHYLFRDRLGIKPLYYMAKNGSMTYSSELKSIRKLHSGLSLDLHAIELFLHLGYIPQPHSIFKEIKKFPSGAFGVFSNGVLEIESYWSPSSFADGSHGFSQNPADMLSALLNESVRDQLVSDVPLGTFLSGGVDSSLVTAIASQNSTSKLRTFNIGFEHEKFDESFYAEKVAKHLGTDHTSVLMSERQALDTVNDSLTMFGEPFADSSAIPTMMVSGIAARDVKVCLSGDGGDELFMGYGMYNWAKRLNQPVLKVLKSPARSIMELLPSRRHQRASWLFGDDSGNQRSHIFSQEQYLFSRKSIGSIMPGSSLPFDVPDLLLSNLTPYENQALFDLKYYLKDDLLVKIDRASMFHSLEVRVPLLDHRVVEFVLGLDKKYRQPGKRSKELLKNFLESYFPRTFFDRPKRGFSVPLANWLRNELSYLPNDYLDPESIEQTGVFNPEEIERLLNEFRRGNDLQYNRIWALSIVQKWILEND